MRTNKNFEHKRETLISKIWDIFLSHGYEKTTLALIINELDISKGVFYHYFSSKEDCAIHCANYYASLCANKLAASLDRTLPPQRQLQQLLSSGQHLFDQNDINQINSSVNMTFHKLLMVSLVKQLAPLYADVFKQGNESGIFSIPYPLETAEILLTLSNFYLDKDFFSWSTSELDQRLKAVYSFFNVYLNSPLSGL